MTDVSRETKIEVRCPLCKSLLFKIFDCLSGVKIEIKCRHCKKIVNVP